MQMLIYNIDISQTAAAGTWSFNTKKFNSAFLKQIIMEPATTTTTYNIEITDTNGLVVFTTDTPATGKFRQEMEVPLKGIHTVTVNTSSANELFKGKLMIGENC